MTVLFLRGSTRVLIQLRGQSHYNNYNRLFPVCPLFGGSILNYLSISALLVLEVLPSKRVTLKVYVSLYLGRVDWYVHTLSGP